MGVHRANCKPKTTASCWVKVMDFHVITWSKPTFSAPRVMNSARAVNEAIPNSPAIPADRQYKRAWVVNRRAMRGSSDGALFIVTQLLRSFTGAAVAASIARAAVPRLSQLAIGADASLGHGTPEEAVAGAGNRGIGL